MLEIRTFGGLSLRKNGETIKDLGSRKAEAILVYVAIGGRPYNRNVLASLLWPESTEDHALASLRVALSELRKDLGDTLEVSRDTVGIKSGAPVYFDVDDLEEKLASDQVEQALEIYRGDFLQGFTIRDCLEFEDWCRWQAERIRRLVANALQAAITAANEGAYYVIVSVNPGASAKFILDTDFSVRSQKAVMPFSICHQVLLICMSCICLLH